MYLICTGTPKSHTLMVLSSLVVTNLLPSSTKAHAPQVRGQSGLSTCPATQPPTVHLLPQSSDKQKGPDLMALTPLVCPLQSSTVVSTAQGTRFII
ncbi:MAG: hypothetical protein FRX49_04026 [Trebouxia sp. A1-2]|nr:MAG: hypothetical protein FRX49_04026 [Trebouxia sp. A1-2]